MWINTLIKKKKKMSVWRAALSSTCRARTSEAQHSRLLSAPLVRFMLFGSRQSQTGQTAGSLRAHIWVLSLRRSRHQRCTAETEYSSASIIHDTWPPTSWITGARYDSQPPSSSTPLAFYVYGSRCTVYEGLHSWHLFIHLLCRLLNLIKTVQILCNRHQ